MIDNISNKTKDYKTLAVAMSQEQVDKIQQFLDGERQVQTDELTPNPDFLPIVNALVTIGRLRLPQSPSPGFHPVWSSWAERDKRSSSL